jgi:hypothetical protein
MTCSNNRRNLVGGPYAIASRYALRVTSKWNIGSGHVAFSGSTHIVYLVRDSTITVIVQGVVLNSFHNLAVPMADGARRTESGIGSWEGSWLLSTRLLDDSMGIAGKPLLALSTHTAFYSSNLAQHSLMSQLWLRLKIKILRRGYIQK